MFINVFGFDVFSNLFCLLSLPQACWQPSCSAVDYCFNAAGFKPELLSRDGVINTIVLTTDDSNALSWTKNNAKNCIIIRVVTAGGNVKRLLPNARIFCAGLIFQHPQARTCFRQGVYRCAMVRNILLVHLMNIQILQEKKDFT